MAKAWSGDGEYVLPARKVEPYRLWFEFLKLALKDPDIKVDKRIYKTWGDVENLSFDKWWSANWRNLFAVETGIRLMERDESLGNTTSSVAIKVPLSLDPNTALQEVRELLHEQGIGNRDAPRVRGKFALSEGSKQGFEKRMVTARLMLRLYGYWIEHEKLNRRKRVNKTISDYHDWVMGWEDKISDKPRGYRGGWRPYMTDAIELYVDWLRSDKTETQASFGLGDFDTETLSGDIEGSNAEMARRLCVRYIRKARRIAENVAKGEFPGKY